MNQTHRFRLFADYFQFYVQDESAKGDLSSSWTKEAVGRLLALAPGTMGVGTLRNMSVPVVVEVHKDEPKTRFANWDHVNECSIHVASGKLVVAGCTDYFPDAARIKVKPGWYRVRILYGGLDSTSEDGLEGNDHYKLVLWPAPKGKVVVVKQWPGKTLR